MSKKIIIVGAGPGGLASGMLLAHKGFDVEIFEKNPVVGGRNGSIQLGEYKFDIGPTFFMMDYVLREIFKTTGRDLEDYVKLTRLDPMYNLHFGSLNQAITIFSDRAKMKAELARVFPGAEKGLDKFYRKEKTRFDRLIPVLSHHNNNILDVFNFRTILALPSFSFGKKLYDVMGNYFKPEYARLSFTFQSKYLGMSPWDCPGAFALVPYTEHQDGVYHLEGGLSQSTVAMAKAIKEDGGKIHCSTPVASLLIKNKKIYGVKLADGREVLADKVIVNADFGYTMNNLVPAGAARKWTPKKLAKTKLSCSIFMMYLGLKRTTTLPHHSILFAKNYRQNVADIFSGKLTDKDFSVYVRDASKTDKTLAPKGKTALYVLVPVANNRSGIDWDKVKGKVRKQALNILATDFGLKDIEKDIEVEKIITPADWEKDYNVYEGAVFNLAHNLNQMIWFRPHNRFEDFKNLYLTGGGTHPGSGLPTIYESGRIAARLICKEFGVKY